MFERNLFYIFCSARLSKQAAAPKLKASLLFLSPGLSCALSRRVAKGGIRGREGEGRAKARNLLLFYTNKNNWLLGGVIL